MPKRSDLPNQIISLLKRRPDTKRNEIHENLGATYQSVQKHLKRLEDEGILRSVMLVRVPDEIRRYKFWVFIDSEFSPQTSERNGDFQAQLCDEIARELVAQNDFTHGLIYDDCQILLGADADIVLTMYAEKPEDVTRFVTRVLRSHPLVKSTSTGWSVSSLEEEEEIAALVRTAQFRRLPDPTVAEPAIP